MVLLLRPPHGRGVTPRQAKSMYVGIPGEGFNQAPVLARHGGVSLTLCPWRRAEGVDVCKRCLPHLKAARQVSWGETCDLQAGRGTTSRVRGDPRRMITLPRQWSMITRRGGPEHPPPPVGGEVSIRSVWTLRRRSCAVYRPLGPPCSRGAKGQDAFYIYFICPSQYSRSW